MDVGGLLSITDMTSLDTSNVEREVVRYAHDRAVCRWEAVQKILSHLRSTRELRITLCRDALGKLQGFADLPCAFRCGDRR